MLQDVQGEGILALWFEELQHGNDIVQGKETAMQNCCVAMQTSGCVAIITHFLR